LTEALFETGGNGSISQIDRLAQQSNALAQQAFGSFNPVLGLPVLSLLLRSEASDPIRVIGPRV
jgi:hypothetical protein